jgi:hypothetical protein
MAIQEILLVFLIGGGVLFSVLLSFPLISKFGAFLKWALEKIFKDFSWQDFGFGLGAVIIFTIISFGIYWFFFNNS